MRKNSDKFIRVNEREEPPLRTLDHGLPGEFRKVDSGEKDPYPYVLRTGDGKCYHGFRSQVWRFSLTKILKRIVEGLIRTCVTRQLMSMTI